MAGTERPELSIWSNGCSSLLSRIVLLSFIGLPAGVNVMPSQKTKLLGAGFRLTELKDCKFAIQR